MWHFRFSCHFQHHKNRKEDKAYKSSRMILRLVTNSLQYNPLERILHLFFIISILICIVVQSYKLLLHQGKHNYNLSWMILFEMQVGKSTNFTTWFVVQHHLLYYLLTCLPAHRFCTHRWRWWANNRWFYKLKGPHS